MIYAAFRNIIAREYREFILDKEQTKRIWTVGQILTLKSSKFGILINGVPGSGKTTLVRAMQSVIRDLHIADPLLTTECHFADAGLCIVNALELCQILQKDAAAYERYRNQSLLAIDDIGTEPPSIQSYGNVYTPIADLIAYRYQRRMYTILTTNIANSQIRPRYGDRIADRLIEMAYIVTMPDVNFRSI